MADDIPRIKRNIGRMIDQGAPEADIDAYLKTEGHTPESIRSAGKPGGSVVQDAGSFVNNLGRQAASGASAGFMDELAAAGNAAVQPIAGFINRNVPDLAKLGPLALPLSGTVLAAREAGRSSQAPTFSERYTQNLAGERGRDKEFEEANPIAAGTAKIGGAIGAAANIPSKLLMGGTTMAGQMGRAALGGGVLGGLTGFGEGEGGLENRLASALTGTAIGAGTGAAAVPLIRGAASLGRTATESTPGQFVGRNIVAPVAERLGLRAVSEAGGDIAENAASRRLAQSLMRDRMTPEAFATKAAEMGPDIPLGAAGGKSMQRLARTTVVAPGEGGQIADDALNAVQRATGTRMAGTLPPDAPYFTAASKLDFMRSAEGKKLYDAARAAGLNASDDMRELMKIPAIKETLDSIGDEAVRLGQPLTPVDVAHMVKQTLNKSVDAAFAAGKNINKDMVRKLADQWEAALWKANPAIEAADQGYAAVMGRVKALDLGRQFMRSGTSEIAGKVSPEALEASFKGMSAEAKESFRTGASSTLREFMASGPDAARRLAKNIEGNDILRRKLIEIYGTADADKLFRMASTEQAVAKFDRFVRGGSDTASKGADLAEQGLNIGSIPTSATGVASKLTGALMEAWRRAQAGNEPIRNEIAKQLFSTDPAVRARAIERLADAMTKMQTPPSGAATGGTAAAAPQFMR